MRCLKKSLKARVKKSWSGLPGDHDSMRKRSGILTAKCMGTSETPNKTCRLLKGSMTCEDSTMVLSLSLDRVWGLTGANEAADRF